MRPSLLPALATLASLALSPGCSSPAGPPGAPSPVYEWRDTGETTFWRFVPLSVSATSHPSQGEFAQAQESCAGPERTSCLTRLGFYQAECSDGRDNDDDGLADFPDDKGCADRHALEEAPACDDDRDNDGDGLADWDGGGFTHPDPECEARPSRDSERAETRRRFGVPF